MNAGAALTVSGVSKHFGGITALQNVSMTLLPGEVHALIGPNGAGKTTLVSLLCGEISADEGQIEMIGQPISKHSVSQRARLGLSRTYQITELFANIPVSENILLSLISRDQPRLSFRQLLGERASSQYEQEITKICSEFSLTDLAQSLPGEMSHGDRRRLELAMAIIKKPKILLLDEPLAGLSGADAAQLIAMIRERLKGNIPILLVEHDMDAVFDLADRITVLVDGKVLMTGTPNEVRESRAVQQAYLSEEEAF